MNNYNESIIMKPKHGHRRTTSDPREFMQGSLIMKNFAFKKDEGKVSQFATIQQSLSPFHKNGNVSQSRNSIIILIISASKR